MIITILNKTGNFPNSQGNSKVFLKLKVCDLENRNGNWESVVEIYNGN